MEKRYFTEKHVFWRQISAFSREKSGIGIDGSQIRFRFPTLESSTRFPDSILDALSLPTKIILLLLLLRKYVQNQCFFSLRIMAIFSAKKRLNNEKVSNK